MRPEQRRGLPRGAAGAARLRACLPARAGVLPDGPAQRIEWWSPRPAGADGQICFESNGVPVLCDDVKAGSREGVLYAFGDINLAGTTAAFRSAP